MDHGVSGSKDRRPALDQLTADVRRHKVQAVVCWRLDRLGRDLCHLVLLLDECQTRDVAFVTLGEGIDTSTPAGRPTCRWRARLDRKVERAGFRSVSMPAWGVRGRKASASVVDAVRPRDG